MVVDLTDLLKEYPPSSTNNARRIVRDRILAYQMNPCDRTANALREVGIEVDHDDYRDHMGEYEQSIS
jgi:hypothetical protein